MLLSDLSPGDCTRRLLGDGLVLRTGPFVFRICSPVPSVAEGLSLMYAGNELVDEDQFVDFSLSLDWAKGLRRWVRPQVRFVYDGESPFEPLPADHAYPLLEWSMNWCISTQAHHFMLLHAAVIERNGFAAILPAPPGSGKSTLCAGLIHRGWRLLSDELALISPTTLEITALARPVSLKNASIQVIRSFEPSAVINRETRETTKGTVTHMLVPGHHLARIGETARPGLVIFPKYVAGAPATLTARAKADSMMDLARNAFNYALLGRLGFETLSDVIARSDCYDFSYSRLDDAVDTFDQLACARIA